jgi:hypothetical protein
MSNRFFDDHKVATLTSVERLLYVTILARCSDECSANIRPTRQQLLTNIGQTRYDIATALKSLERNQLLKCSNLPLDKIREDKKRLDKNLRAKKIKDAPQPDAVAPVPLGQNLVGHYCEVYKSRYGVNPAIRQQDARALKGLGESLGGDKVKGLLAAYLSMSNAWFITRAHDLQTFASNLNQVQNFVATGRIVTAVDAKSAESGDALANQIARLTGGER